MGPTAVGKTKFAIELAKRLSTEIISCDSRQIYKEMNIGTACPTAFELSQVKHHFIRNKSIFEYYNASMYEFEALGKIDKLLEKHDSLVVAGGSGLYIDAILYGIDDLPTIDAEIRENLQKRFETDGIESLRFELKRVDPKHYEKVDLKNPKRILKALEVFEQTGKPYSSFLTGNTKKRNFEPCILVLNMDRKILYDRINKRVEIMIKDGLIQEAKPLLAHREVTALKTVGYREIFGYLDGSTTKAEAIDLIKCSTRRYARKQITWFRRYKNANWLDITNGFDVNNLELNC